MSNQNSPQIYQVKLIDEGNSISAILQVHSDEMIMDAADRQGIHLPVSCRAGACTSCTGRLVEGKVEHQNCFLSRQEEDAGFILTCTAYPLSNCTVLIHQEEQLLNSSNQT